MLTEQNKRIDAAARHAAACLKSLNAMVRERCGAEAVEAQRQHWQDAKNSLDSHCPEDAAQGTGGLTLWRSLQILKRV